MDVIINRLLNLKKRLEHKDVNGIIIQSEENRLYLTGLRSSAGMILYAANDERYFIIDGRYEEISKRVLSPLDFKVKIISDNDYMGTVRDICKKYNFYNLAFEDDYTNINQYNNLMSALNLELVPFSKELLGIRQIKDIVEIENISKAQEIAEKSFIELLNYINIGITEKDIQARLTYLLLNNGSDNGNFGICCVSGKNSSLVHGVATDKKIQYGDNILLDFGAIYGGYYSDMTRTFCIGEAKDDFTRAYEVVLCANEESIKSVKVGESCSYIDKISRDIISNAGYKNYFNHNLGHGLGINIHEGPKLSPKSTNIIEAGNVITIEPGIYIPNKFGIRIEDMLYIKNCGVENLTHINKKLLII